MVSSIILAEIKELYFEENFTQKQIADRLEISQQRVSQVIAEIKQKEGTSKKVGVLTQKPEKMGSKFWRFHALHFLIYPYYFFPRYHRTRSERGTHYFTHRDWKVNIHEDTIELVLRKGFDFAHVDKWEALQMAQESLNRALWELSNKLGFKYAKEGRIAVKLVKQHLANTNSPLAKSQKGQYIKIKGTDGKVWLIIDKSKGIMEHEFVHTGRELSDSETIAAVLNDLREGGSYGHRLMVLEKAMIKVLQILK